MSDVTLPIALIHADGQTQQRVAASEATIAAYAELIADGVDFPAIEVLKDEAGEHWLWDGHHRLAAHIRAGRDTILANVQPGSLRDAILASVSANAANPLQRTNEDKRKAVSTLLKDPEWSLWSNHKIAKVCGVTQPFVGKMREAHKANQGGNGFRFPEDCLTAAARITHARTADTVAMVEGLQQLDGLQKTVLTTLSEQHTTLSQIEQIETVERLLEERRLLGWQWPDQTDRSGVASAYLRRLHTLAEARPQHTQVAVAISGSLAEQLHGVNALEKSDTVFLVLAAPKLSPAVRKAALIAYVALKSVEEAGDYSLDWTHKPWFPPGACAVLDRRKRAKTKKEKAEAEERAWITSAVGAGVPTAIAIAEKQTDVSRLLTWLDREQRLKEEKRGRRGEVRKTLRAQLKAAGVVLVACPDHPVLFFKQGERCPDCYRTPAEIHKRRAEEKTARHQEELRLKQPMVAVGGWLAVRQDAEVQSGWQRQPLAAGTCWAVTDIAQGKYQLTCDDAADVLWLDIAAVNRLLGTVLQVCPPPTAGEGTAGETPAEDLPEDAPWWAALSRAELVRVVCSRENWPVFTDRSIDFILWGSLTSVAEARAYLAALDAEVAAK